MPFALFVASANRPLDDDDDGAPFFDRTAQGGDGLRGVPERGMDAVPRRARLVQAPRPGWFQGAHTGPDRPRQI